jgi:hypothetical protein
VRPATPARPGTRSQFNALFSDASPDQAPAKKDDSGVSVAIVVPAPPKLLLPVVFTPPGDQETPSAVSSKNQPDLHAELTLDTVDLEQPLSATEQPVEELAFAAKLVEAQGQPVAPTALPQPVAPSVLPPLVSSPASPQASEPRLATPVPATRQVSQTEADERDQQTTPGSTQLFSTSQPAIPKDATPSASIAPKNIETQTPAPAIEHVAPTIDRPSASPLNEITLRVANADQTSASIRMVDHNGELRVAVRASDPQLADSLRGNVEQLTSRLNNNGWNTEVWKPSVVAPAVRTQSSSQEMSQGQSGQKNLAENFSDREQQNRKQKYPDWVEEFYANNQ